MVEPVSIAALLTGVASLLSILMDKIRASRCTKISCCCCELTRNLDDEEHEEKH